MITFIDKNHQAPKKNIILFIHGFMGNQNSWIGKEDNAEITIPKLLKLDSYISEQYDFALFSYFSKLVNIFGERNIIKEILRRLLPNFLVGKIEFKANLHIEEISQILKTDVNAKLREYERIIIIAHSMGGLVAKSFIIDILEKKETNESAKIIANKIAGYISIAVPHNGSNLAEIGNIILNHPQINNLMPLENYIHTITTKWLLSKELPLTAYFQCKYDRVVAGNSSIGYEIRDIETEYFEYDHTSVLRPKVNDSIIDSLTNTIKTFEKANPKDSYYHWFNHFISKIDDGEAALKAFVVHHENKSFRNKKFHELKQKAKCSMFIMGAGITNINSDEISSYLNKGISVRLLMMNPNILLEHFNFKYQRHEESNKFDYLSAFDMMLKGDYLGNFYDRSGYNLELIASFKRLKKFVQDYKKNSEEDANKGFIDMRVFNSFIPLSFTSVNSFKDEGKEKEGSEEFIVEFSLPYSDKRIHIPITNESDKAIYTSFTQSLENLWKKSINVQDVSINPLIINHI